MFLLQNYAGSKQKS